MLDYRIGAVEPSFIPDIPPVTKDVTPAKDTFAEAFKAAMDIVNETNTLIGNSDQLQRDFATGKTDDVLSVILSQEKAQSALNFTVQITNKIIESYREIMRMQV